MPCEKSICLTQFFFCVGADADFNRAQIILPFSYVFRFDSVTMHKAFVPAIFVCTHTRFNKMRRILKKLVFATII